MSILRFLLSALLILFFSSSAMADTYIELGDLTISYEIGSIDPETLNGNARNLVVKNKTLPDTVFLIDEYNLYSTNDGSTITIEDLYISGMTIILPEQAMFTVKKITWSDGQVDDNWLEMLIENSEVGKPFYSNLGVMTVNGITGIDQGRTVVSIDTISIDSIDNSNNPYNNLPIGDASVEIRNIFIPVDANDDPEIIQNLKNMGFDGFRFSIGMTGQNFMFNDRVDTRSEIYISADNLMDLKISMGFGFSNFILQEMDQMYTNTNKIDFDSMRDEYLGLLMLGMTFNNMELIISDKGLIDIVLDAYAAERGLSRKQAVSIMMDTVASSIGVVAPNTYQEIAPSIRDFLNRGGTISARLNPAQPLPIASLLGVVAIPDQAKDLLGLSVKHRH